MATSAISSTSGTATSGTTNSNSQPVQAQTQAANKANAQAILSSLSAGSGVNVTNLDTNQEKDYILLSEYDSNVKMGIISIDSPIGAGLAGRRAGDTVEIEMPNGSVISYEVNSVGISRFVSTSNSDT